MAKANPQQKKVYDTIVLQALRFIMEKEQAGQIAEQAKQDPVSAMVNTTLAVLKQIKAAAKNAGRDYAGEAMFMKPAAKEIMAHIIEMLVAFGIVQKEQAKGVYEAATQQIDDAMGGGQQAPAGMLAQGA